MEILFSKGRSGASYPVKLMYHETPVALAFPAQVMFVAPKRNFKRAHDRNKLKRRMREVYRLHKLAFYEDLQKENKKMILAFIYTSKKTEPYQVIEKAMLKQLKKIIRTV